MTLKKLAQHLGISQSTVSRALNGFPEVNEKTRQKVIEAAKQLNYRPNPIATRLASGKSWSIGHVIPVSENHEMVNPIFSDFLAGAGEAYSKAGYHINLSVVKNEDVESSYKDMAELGIVDGILVQSPRFRDFRIPILKQLGIPFLVHGRVSTADEDYSWMDVDNFRAFKKATQYLIDLGHTDIALLNGLETMDFAYRRRAGFEGALAENGLFPKTGYLKSHEMTVPYGYDSVHEIMQLARPPTAFVVSSMIVAIGVRRALLELGLKLGSDVSVIIYDDQLSFLGNEGESPVFTALTSSVRKAGKRCAEMLISMVQGKKNNPCHELWETELIIGETTGPPKGSKGTILSKTSNPYPSLGFNRFDFPQDFVFGTASSSYQIEGHSHGGAGKTHWDTFAATHGNVNNMENGAIACDHFHRYKDDFKLVSSLGLDAWRFSTSWARIFPENMTTPNQEGLDFYDRLVDEMLACGLKPFLTLYHWELPTHLSDQGGWTNRDIASWFGQFATTMGKLLGDRLYSVAPINEPWCVAWLGHFTGEHAPGLRDIRAAARAMHHVLLAHGTAVQSLRAINVDNIGLVVNFEYSQPLDNSKANTSKADLYDAIYNRWFLGGVQKREYPKEALPHLKEHLPNNWEEDFSTIGEPVDWIGINYYTRKLIAEKNEKFPGWLESDGALPKTGMGWEIYPEGLGHFLRWVANDYANGLPIYVTENGMADDSNEFSKIIDDSARQNYLRDHIRVVKDVISEGVDVRGYFIWSLLDNYEWALGYGKRFGLVHVDYDTMVRTPKSTCEALRNSLKSHNTDFKF